MNHRKDNYEMTHSSFIAVYNFWLWLKTLHRTILQTCRLSPSNEEISPLVVFFTVTQHPNLLISSLINTFFTNNIAIFNPTTQTHFFTIFNKKNSKKKVYKETTYTFFYDTLKPKFKKNFLWNLKILKLGMPKKMTPKSQAKIKPSFP